MWSNLREVKWGSCFGFNDTNILAAVRTCLCGTLIITEPQPQNWDQTLICEIWQSSKSNLRLHSITQYNNKSIPADNSMGIKKSCQKFRYHFGNNAIGQSGESSLVFHQNNGVWKIKEFVRQILFTRVVIIYWTGNVKLPYQSCPSFHPETFQFLQIFSRFITCKNWYERIPKLFKELYHWFE